MTTKRRPHPTTESLENFIFEGIDGEECEDLIHAVRLQARKAGHMGDNLYMAQWASSCVVGNALRWYIALPKEVKYDWEELEQALAAEYPINNETRSRSPRPRPGDVRRGRLKIISSDPTREGYLSNGTGAKKSPVPTTSIAEALHVEWIMPPDNGTSKLRMLNQAIIGGKQYDLLGVYFHEASALGQGLLAYASLAPAVISGAGTLECTAGSNPTSKVDIWRVSPDGIISMHWDDGSKVHELTAMSDKLGKTIWAICQSDLAAFNTKYRSTDPCVPVRLFLEPLA